MALVDEIKGLIAQCLSLESDVFIARMKALVNRSGISHAVPIFNRLLTHPDTNMQLRFLLLNSIAQLPDNKWLPVLAAVLASEKNIRLLNEAFNALVRFNSIKAYLTLAAYLHAPAETDGKTHALPRIEAMTKGNLLLQHLDLLLRKPSDGKTLAASTDYLIANLPDDAIAELFPYLESEPAIKQIHILQILHARPNTQHMAYFFAFFQRSCSQMRGELFKIAAQTIVAYAERMNKPGQIFNRLNELRPAIAAAERQYFTLLLLKLNSTALLPELLPAYPALSSNDKIVLLTFLNPKQSDSFRPFLRRELRQENMPQILQGIVAKLLEANDAAYIFQTLKKESGLRRHLILEFVLETDPPNLDPLISDLLRQSTDDRVALLAVEYLLKHNPDEHASVLRAVLDTGISDDVKQKIIRNLPQFSPPQVLAFINQFFDNKWYSQTLKKDFLIALARVLRECSMPLDVEDKIINHVLIGLEEAEAAEIIHFITFFEGYAIKTKVHATLIGSEWRLIQQSVLKNTTDQALVKRIYKYIQKTEKLRLP